MDDVINHELEDIGTEMAGAVNLHKTRTTAEAVTINPPVQDNPGAVDMREREKRNDS
jgi:hypothetical protein